jgi:hypothetical protein
MSDEDEHPAPPGYNGTPDTDSEGVAPEEGEAGDGDGGASSVMHFAPITVGGGILSPEPEVVHKLDAAPEGPDTDEPLSADEAAPVTPVALGIMPLPPRPFTPPPG